MGAEAADKGEIEKGLAEKQEAIKDAEAHLECLTRGMTYNHIEMLQSMAKAIDKGYSGREALQWSKLLYLPFPMMPEKNVSNKARSWIQLSEYEASVDEQIAKVNQIVIKKCHMQNCDLTFIDEWSHRWEYQ